MTAAGDDPGAAAPGLRQRVAAHLLAHGEWTYSRASGPGGQHRDHAETRAELTLRPEHLAGLPERVAQRLHASWGLDRQPLRLRAGTERSRERNRALVAHRLAQRVGTALAPPPPPRRPTRPGAGARARRRAGKEHRAAAKALRRAPASEA
ncbi:MAG TPA: hypothetical protein VNT51_08445 [Miltoncostaeaceae bacterium]|nr:hypothetical protein [Miltoncostaeaceae bacterium]